MLPAAGHPGVCPTSCFQTASHEAVGARFHGKVVVIALTLLAAALAGASGASAQVPVTSITLGWAVDTTASPVREIVRTVAAYYQLPSPGRTPTTLWVAEEQARYPLYDFAAPQLYRTRLPATIVEVSPTSPDSTVYVVKTVFAVADSAGQNIQPFGLQRLYVHPAAAGSGAPYGWQLAGALAELTRSWTVQRVGGITYHFSSGYSFRRDRAEAANQFLDSAARRLGVSRPGPIDYYLTASWESVNRLMGLDWGLTGAAFAGRALPENRLVFAGNPALGEAFMHELAHVVLAAFGSAEQRHRMIEEGVATWLGGGNRGPDVGTYFTLLNQYLIEHPEMTLSGLLSRFDAEEAFYATGALIADGALRHGGLSALRRVLTIGPRNEELLGALPGLLGVSPGGLDAWWRSEAARLAGAH